MGWNFGAGNNDSPNFDDTMNEILYCDVLQNSISKENAVYVSTGPCSLAHVESGQ
jgi:hypothetical protein